MFLIEIISFAWKTFCVHERETSLPSIFDFSFKEMRNPDKIYIKRIYFVNNYI